MMHRKLLFFIAPLMLLLTPAKAAPPDSLFAIESGNGWAMLQRARAGETIITEARRFHVPVALLAAANGRADEDKLPGGSLVTVPLGSYNILTYPPETVSESRPLFYRASVRDGLKGLSRRSGMSVSDLAARNGLGGAVPMPGQVLLVGWVRYDATPIAGGMRVTEEAPRPAVTAPIEAPTGTGTNDYDTERAPKMATPTLSQLYNEQTADGKNVVSERGSVGFYPLTSGGAEAAVYAFHNKASKGSIMIVRNLNNGKAIYVKVLGPLPVTKAFAGCILGLSDKAKAALGARETKAFCELSYAGY